ncbi:DUF397 domain-containing protein [Streptomyces sp. ME03-5684b]|nr:DUF397 domain-containing protein [Streptomyces sp. ME03-5684b]MDX3317351.1 DUF397 domain-containing protein [Streptomyces sp. ME03-5684b]
MRRMDNWRKSSYSGPDDGNECVQIATSTTRVAVRDSKAPAHGTFTVPIGVFATFVDGIKRAEGKL